MLTPVVITAADSLPVSLEAAKQACRIDHTDEDAFILRLIETARDWIQPPSGFFFRSIAPQTLELRLARFPSLPVLLPGGPVTAITQVTYFDEYNTSQTISPSFYFADDDCIVWTTNMMVPTVYDRPGAARIRYTAGPATPPKNVQHAITMLVAHWYENREAVATVGATQMIPIGAMELLHTARF